MMPFLQWAIASAYVLAAGLLIARSHWPRMEAVAVGLAGLALLMHIAMVLERGLASEQLPIITRYENFTVDALAMACIWFVAQWRWPQLRRVGIVVLPMVAFIVIVALSYSRGQFPMSPALRTNWLIIHASFNSIAIGFAALAFAAGLMLRRNDSYLIGRLMSWAFFFWCAMVAAGSYWASIAWGRFWGWDPIECWSLGTIFLYAFVLHLRIKPQWCEGYRGMLVGVLPFGLMMFTTYGLVFVMRSVHGQYVFQ